MKKEHRFILTVKNFGSRRAAASAVLCAFGVRAPDGCEFHLKPYAKPYKVVVFGAAKPDGVDPLEKAFVTVENWNGVVHLAGDKSPVIRTRKFKKRGNK